MGKQYQSSRGAGAAEYAIMLVMLSLVAIGSMNAFQLTFRKSICERYFGELERGAQWIWKDNSGGPSDKHCGKNPQDFNPIF